jgi:dihydrofolate reductase
MPERKPLAMVVAMTRSRVIGRTGSHRLLWHYPEDMKRFREVTRGHAVIMGRATYDSIGRALPGRRNIVISRDPELRIPDCDVAHSLERAVELAREQDPEPRVLGGAQIYAEAMPHATKLFVTWLDDEHHGDARFPEIDPDAWIETEREHGKKLTFVTLERKTR